MEPTIFNVVTVTRVASIVSLPLSIIQSYVILMYIFGNHFHNQQYYQCLTVEGIVQACLIYGSFFRKSLFLVPYIALQFFVGMFYISLIFYCWLNDNVCSSRKNLKEFPVLLAAITYPLQCVVAVIAGKCYHYFIEEKKKERHQLQEQSQTDNP